MKLTLDLDAIWQEDATLGKAIQDALIEEVRATARREVKKVMELHQTELRSAVASVTKRLIAGLDTESIAAATKLELVNLRVKKGA